VVDSGEGEHQEGERQDGERQEGKSEEGEHLEEIQPEETGRPQRCSRGEVGRVNFGWVTNRDHLEDPLDRAWANFCEELPPEHSTIGLYSLRNSAILDSGANVHVFNQLSRFRDFHRAEPGDYIAMPEGRAPVLGYGTVDIQVRVSRNHPRDRGKFRVLRLQDVACCQNFAVNLVSLRQLRRQGFFWDNERDPTTLRLKCDRSIACYLTESLGQYVLEVMPRNVTKATFHARRNTFNSWTERNPSRAEAYTWHLRLGHSGAQAVRRLVNSTRGVNIAGGPETWECQECAQAKAVRRIRREPRPQATAPGDRIGVDIHEFKEGYGGFRYLLMITDRYSKMSWDYYLYKRDAPSILNALVNFLDGQRGQNGMEVKILECDNELDIYELKKALEHFPYGLRIEPSAPNTQAQNGLAERHTRTIFEKMNAMRASSKLPEHLWPELVRAAIYLSNRTPRQGLDWKTPYEVFYTYLARKAGPVVADRRPQEAHLRVYGCKAYAMTQPAQLRKRRLDRFDPKAWIGYLVGYNSTDIYRIWIPLTGKIILTRDVTFNEKEGFEGDIEAWRDDFQSLSIERIAYLLIQMGAIEESITVNTDPIYAEDAEVTEFPEPHGNSDSGDTDIDNTDPDTARGSQAEDEVARWQEEEELPVPPDHDDVEDPPDPEVPNLLVEDNQTESGNGLTRLGPVTRSRSGAAKSLPRRYLPTPPDSPPTVLLASAIREDPRPPGSQEGSQEGFSQRTNAWKAAFHAGSHSQALGTHNGKVIDRSQRIRLSRRQGVRPVRTTKIVTEADVAGLIEKGILNQYTRREFPPEPRWHSEVEVPTTEPRWKTTGHTRGAHRSPKRQPSPVHPMAALFRQAEEDHLQSHREMQSWVEHRKSDAKGHQILDCMWVYLYKFDKRGKFKKCKARLVVRGDQQAIGTDETYAATLAGRSFRALIAIANRFDLELKQYDAVNAFVNAPLDEVVYMRLPPGRRRSDKVLLLKKALYGLRKSPLLWQRHLTKSLTDFECEKIKQDPCILIQDGILVFFYVDDIVFAYRRSQEHAASQLIKRLESRYKLTGGEDLQWFTGIEIVRDRVNRTVWLSQAAYIDKIAALAGDCSKPPDTPLSSDELLPYNGQAEYASINHFQRKIGSLLWAAINTRPDIAFAVSKLGRFSHNPSEKHHDAADRVIHYLCNYRGLGLQYGGSDDFIVASDASFADNTSDRKSSQAYAIKIFGGLTMWSANKQDTVTTSTTEAELLALAQAAKEGIFVGRLLNDLTVQFDDPKIRIQCDNLQTIGLVTKEIAQLKTKLRHVDIHNHWLRQEVERGTIAVEFTPSGDMIADGLTKALQGLKFETFRHQIGLVDISNRLDERRAKEFTEEEDLERLVFG